MRVHVTYMAQLRRLTGKASEEVILAEDGTLRGLLARIGELHGAAAAPPTVLVFRGDEQVREQTAALADGDRVTLLTPMAGG